VWDKFLFFINSHPRVSVIAAQNRTFLLTPSINFLGSFLSKTASVLGDAIAGVIPDYPHMTSSRGEKAPSVHIPGSSGFLASFCIDCMVVPKPVTGKLRGVCVDWGYRAAKELCFPKVPSCMSVCSEGELGLVRWGRQ
jgi:hypothetical protein